MVLAYNIRRSTSKKYLKGGDEVAVGQKFCKKYPRWQILTYKDVVDVYATQMTTKLASYVHCFSAVQSHSFNSCV